VDRASVTTQLLQVQTFLFDVFMKQLPVPFPNRFKLPSGAVLHEGCRVSHSEGSGVRTCVLVAIHEGKATIHDVEKNTVFVTELASLALDGSQASHMPLWANDHIGSADLQARAMDNLYALMLQLTSTSMSLPSSAATDALVSLSAASIFVHADAVMHLRANGAITSDLLLNEKIKLRPFVGALHSAALSFDLSMYSIFCAPFARARANIVAYIKQNCYAPSIHGDSPSFPALFCYDSKDPAQDSNDLHNMVVIRNMNPRCGLRFSSMLLCFLLFLTTVRNPYHPTYAFVSKMLEKTGNSGKLPPQGKSSHFRRAWESETKSGPFNSLMTWAFHETFGGIGCEDFALFRDMNFLMRLLQVPITYFRQKQSVFNKEPSLSRIRPLKKLCATLFFSNLFHIH